METVKMSSYAFEIILADVTEASEELANKLFDAGGDDCSPSSCNGIVIIASIVKPSRWKKPCGLQLQQS